MILWMAVAVYFALLIFLTIFLLLLFIELVQDFFFHKVPFVKSDTKVIKHALANMNPKEGDLIYDLGCGDGKFLYYCAKKFPQAKIVGFEKSFLPFLMGKFFSLTIRRLPNYKIKFGNFYNEDLSQPDIIYCFLFPNYMKSLSPKFKEEIRLETLIISSTFPMKDWTPFKEVPLKKGKEGNWGKLFFYQLEK